VAIKKLIIRGIILLILCFNAYPSLSQLQNCSELEYLKQSTNVILSPHIAGWSHESYFKLSNILAEKIEEWANLEASNNEI